MSRAHTKVEASRPALDELLARSASMHSHLCPRQVLGVRLGMYAASILELALPQSDKRVVAFVETDGCFADGVGAATGCWLGRRTLRLVDHGKPAATVADTELRRAVRIWPHPMARALAASYAPDAASRWESYLLGYQRMPDDRLFLAREVKLTLSLEALISSPGERAVCAACGEEIMNQRQVMLDGLPYCRGCAGDSYFSYTGSAGTIESPLGPLSDEAVRDAGAGEGCVIYSACRQ